MDEVVERELRELESKYAAAKDRWDAGRSKVQEKLEIRNEAKRESENADRVFVDADAVYEDAKQELTKTVDDFVDAFQNSEPGTTCTSPSTFFFPRI